jgi:thermitase
MRRLLALLIAAAVTAALAVPAVAAAPSEATTAAALDRATILVRVAKADRDRLHDRLGYKVINRITGIGVDVVAVPRHRIAAALDRFRAQPEVIFAERNRVVRLAAKPNDSFIADQYALKRIRAFAGWGDYGHRWRRTGGARLAIIDSGIDQFHPEFENRVSHCRSWLTGTGLGLPTCQDTQFHGTHVAGIAAATAGNREGIAGIAFDSRILALQAFNSSGLALTADIAAAIVFAARNGAQVANYSFSAPEPSQTEQAAVRYAAARKVVQVAAAGNGGEATATADRAVQYPGAYSQVIAVSATNQNDRLAAYSSRGRQVEVAAPGTAILSTLPGSLVYGALDGTSMAAPHVAGLAALLREQGFTAAETRRRIRNTADDLGPDGRDWKYGHGRINLARAVR